MNDEDRNETATELLRSLERAIRGFRGTSNAGLRHTLRAAPPGGCRAVLARVALTPLGSALADEVRAADAALAAFETKTKRPTGLWK
jgi:hypothetical protein